MLSRLLDQVVRHGQQFFLGIFPLGVLLGGNRFLFDRRFAGLHLGNIGDARFRDQFFEELIFCPEKKFIRFPGRTDVDETSVKSEPFFFVIRYRGLSGIGTLRQQISDQKKQFFIFDDITP